MKKILLVVMILLVTVSMGYTAVTPDTVHDTVTTAAGYGSNLDLGGDVTRSEITCIVSGTAGTMNVDIDGSLDGTTYYGMYDDITALGGFSVVNQPYNYYQVDVDACSGACSITIKCQPRGGN